MSMLLVVAVATCYLVCVRALRYRRLHLIHQLCPPHKMDEMTPALAQQIIHIALMYETPGPIFLGTQVAMFKVWGIPTIADTLLKTKTFHSPFAMTRRIVDTAILLSTVLVNPILGPGSGAQLDDPSDYDPRGAIALARINWLHRKYHISQDDYRYNLALFVLEPLGWTERFGWRSHTPVERHAFYVFWMELGRRMSIDIPWSSLQGMKEWAREYEVACMVPSTASAEIVQIGIKRVASRLPDVLGLRAAVPYVVSCMLNKRERRAMDIPDAPLWLEYFVHGAFHVSAFIIRHAALPRRKPAKFVTTDNPTDEYLAQLAPEDLPRMLSLYKRPVIPWYYPEPTGFRKWLQDTLGNLGILSKEKFPSKRYKSDGYRLEELGPDRFEKDGHEEVMRMAEALQGTPVIGPWSLTGGKSHSTQPR